jgi:molybdopterin-guanine dinucleotide biosynthesis protein A
MTLPCDMPELPEDLPARLASAMRPGLNAVLPEVAGELEPACGLWRPAALAVLHDYVASGRTSLHGFARAAGLGTVRFGAHAAPAFANANTPETLAALERRSPP